MRTLTGTYTRNSTVYSYTITAPDQLAFIYSRHLYLTIAIRSNGSQTVSGDDDDRSGSTPTPLANHKIQVAMLPTALAGYEYRYTDSDGSFTVDVARMIQVVTDNAATELNLDDTASVALWKMSRRYVQFYDSGTQIASVAFDAANGADARTDRWSLSRRLRWFKSYPWTFDFPNVDEVRRQIDGGASTVATWTQVSTAMTYAMQRVTPKLITALNAATRQIKLSASWYAADIDGNMQSATNTVVIDIDSRAACDDCVYLRWLGRHGEIFYWLFKKADRSDAVTRTASARSGVSDRYNSYGVLENEDSNALSKTRKLGVAAVQLDSDEMEIIGSIETSPIIDMFVGWTSASSPRWQRVSIDAGTYKETLSRQSDAMKSRSIELTLIMPDGGGVTL